MSNWNKFETERLILRKMKKSDAELICKLNSDPVVMKYIGPTDESLENAQSYVNMRVDQYAEIDGLGIFIAELKESKEPIGWCCLKYLDDTKEIEIGYRMLAAHWNKGYATEASKCLVDFGFNEMGLEEIVGVTLPENLASQTVLKKNGLKYVGIATYYKHELAYFKRCKTD